MRPIEVYTGPNNLIREPTAYLHSVYYETFILGVCGYSKNKGWLGTRSSGVPKMTELVFGLADIFGLPDDFELTEIIRRKSTEC